MTKLLTILLFSFSAFGGIEYSCFLQARDHLMDPAVKVTKDYNTDKNIEITAKGFRLKVQTTLVEGKRKLALWLGTENKRSAVTLADLDQNAIYLNLVIDEPFAIASCVKKTLPQAAPE